jgi:hypothetical protein
LRFCNNIIYLMIACMALQAQRIPTVAPAPPQQRQLVAQQKDTLTVTVVEGEGGKNSVRNRTAVAPIVEVKDAEGKPVPGAEVVFQLPAVGPSGSFNGWLKTQTVRADEQGRAAATGYAPNTEPGRFNIKVTATSGTNTGSAVISQVNTDNGTSVSSGGNRGWVKWVAIIGGAAAIGGVAAAVGGDDDAAPGTARTPVGITAGAVTVGGPR